jgi:hypothetical protein
MMKLFLRGLKLFAPFFLLFFGLTIAWAMHLPESNMPNWSTPLTCSCLALGSTILWLDWRKNQPACHNITLPQYLTQGDNYQLFIISRGRVLLLDGRS